MFHLHSDLCRSHPVCPLCFAPLAAAHTAAGGRPTRRHYQHNILIRAAHHSAVGNTVNTRGDRWHDHCADDRLVYSPYKQSPLTREESPLLPLQAVATCELLLLYSLLTMRSSSCTADTRMYCGVCGVGKYYVGQKP